MTEEDKKRFNQLRKMVSNCSIFKEIDGCGNCTQKGKCKIFIEYDKLFEKLLNGMLNNGKGGDK